MKTTVEIPDALLAQAKKVAAVDETTLRVLIVEGLRRVVAERQHRKPFRLKDAGFRGNGLQPEVASLPWERILEMSYGDRFP